MDYATDPRFSRYVLEESYVLGVHVGVDWAVVELDVCLSKEHPHAGESREGDWAPYRPAELWFKGAKVDFDPSGVRPTLDPDDTWDYGDVHRFQLLAPNEYLLEGDVGRLHVVADEAYVRELSDG